MAIHSSILAWRIPGQRSLAGYSPWGHRVGHDWATNTTTTMYTQFGQLRNSKTHLLEPAPVFSPSPLPNTPPLRTNLISLERQSWDFRRSQKKWKNCKSRRQIMSKRWVRPATYFLDPPNYPKLKGFPSSCMEFLSCSKFHIILCDWGLFPWN